MSGYTQNFRLPVALPKGPASESTLRRNRGGLRMVDLNEKAIASINAAPTKTCCAFCDWEFDGTASQGRQEARTHRETEHPEVLLVKSKRRQKRQPTPPRKVS